MKNTPKLRFKGFEGEWEEKTLGDICSFTKGKGYSKSDISEKGFPLFLYGRMYTNYSFSVNSVDTYASLKEDSYISEGNEVVIPASGETAQDIVRASAISASGIVLGGDLNILKFDLVKYSTPFIALSFSNGNLYDQLIKSAQGKTVVHLHNSEIQKGKILIPSLPEQRKLSSYFTHLDTLIESSRQKVEKLKQVKAASLQSFFPTHGERTPNVRFKGFEGDWKKVKFGEVFDFLKNNSLSRAELSDEGFVMNVHYGDVLIKYPEFLDVAQEKMTFIKNSLLADKLYKSCPLQNGDVVIADAAEDETVGKCTELVNVNNVPIVSGLHTIPVRPRLSFASKYLGFFLNSSLFHDQLLVHIQGSKISSISKSAILKTFVYFPSLHEQRLIAQYFTHLDSLLSLERQRYAKLQQVKRASLSQMLV